MNNEWQDLPTMQDVARAQYEGWEIKAMNMALTEWFSWDGRAWNVNAKFRGRPRQPAKITVTSECWRNIITAALAYTSTGKGMIAPWQRFPAGDITGEVEE